MKIAVIFYSMSNNTRLVAERIAEKTGADLIEIIPNKHYPEKGMKKFIVGGFCAMMGEKPKLKDYEFCADKYDTVIIGSPVWASCFAPPIRAFLSRHRKDLSEKNAAAYFCSSGGDAQGATEKLRDFIGADKLMATMSLVDPAINGLDEKEIDNFCSKIL